ncbi:MAG TPA: hypothetical protein VHT92_02660 [Candidatus Cybelea sp.]|nr:hypothetical protein [Candidatus Cybelea sp.]
MAVFACAAISGLLFVAYLNRTQREGQIARLQVYEQFSELPRVDRLASAGLRTSIQNDDEISSDGTTSVTVALLPKSAFAAQFEPWGKKDRLLLKMRVIAPDFEVSPVLDETQQVPGDAMTYAWILRAQASGDQVVNIRGVAFRETSAGIIYDRATVVNAMRSIRVKQPFSMEAWTPIVTGLLGLLGTGALPLLIQARGKRGDELDPRHAKAFDQ